MIKCFLINMFLQLKCVLNLTISQQHLRQTVDRKQKKRTTFLPKNPLLIALEIFGFSNSEISVFWQKCAPFFYVQWLEDAVIWNSDMKRSERNEHPEETGLDDESVASGVQCVCDHNQGAFWLTKRGKQRSVHCSAPGTCMEARFFTSKAAPDGSTLSRNIAGKV